MDTNKRGAMFNFKRKRYRSRSRFLTSIGICERIGGDLIAGNLKKRTYKVAPFRCTLFLRFSENQTRHVSASSIRPVKSIITRVIMQIALYVKRSRVATKDRDARLSQSRAVIDLSDADTATRELAAIMDGADLLEVVRVDDK